MTTLVVDKTGTLTEGKPRLMTVLPLDSINEHQLLKLVASLENVSAVIGNTLRLRLAQL